MFATPPANVTFAAAFGHTYTTTDIYSTRGGSGGPLCVQADNGNYYPAAIYLGGSGETVVRSIDSSIIDLFNRAQVSGNGGANNTSGGITQVNTPLSGGSFATAAIKVTILPTAAASSASWRIGTAPFPSGHQYTGSPGTYTVTFGAGGSFLAPSSTPVTVSGGSLASVTVTYSGITAQPTGTSVVATGNATFSVQVSGTPTSYQWQLNGAPIVGATAASYTRPNVSAADAGSYSVMVTWGTQGSLTSSGAALTVTPLTFAAWGGQMFTAAELNNAALSGPAASYTGDDIPNLLKFALNLNPKLANPAFMVAGTGTSGLPLVGVTVAGGQPYLTLEYVRRTAASSPGITYLAEFGNSPAVTGGWSATGIESVTPIDANWERVKVTDQQPNLPARFGRVRVTQP